MSKKNKVEELPDGISRSGGKVTIDFSQWATQKKFAEKRGVNEATVRSWVFRGKLDHCFIPELGLTLVKL